jgi:hypothetical protein
MSNKKVLILIAILIVFIPISILWDRSLSYRPKYTGEHPELFSVAVNSLLGTKGYAQSERPFQPELVLQEEDNYGRKLFFYNELEGISAYSLVISQKSDSEYVYFYPDYNFISSEDEVFSDEETEVLKRKNDWGKEINEDKCTKTNIVTKKKLDL